MKLIEKHGHVNTFKRTIGDKNWNLIVVHMYVYLFHSHKRHMEDGKLENPCK
jgi:hypothetical protein